MKLFLSGAHFGDFDQSSFAAGSGIFLQKTFFDGFVIFGLSFGHIFGSRISFESFESRLDIALDLLVVSCTLDRLTCGFFCGFDNRH